MKREVAELDSGALRRILGPLTQLTRHTLVSLKGTQLVYIYMIVVAKFEDT
jgi:hypothetical protein